MKTTKTTETASASQKISREPQSWGNNIHLMFSFIYLAMYDPEKQIASTV